MFNRLSVAAQLVILVVLSVGVILAAVIGYGYISARLAIEQELEARAFQMNYAAANKIEAVEVAVAKVAEGTALMLAMHPPSTDEEIYLLLQQIVVNNREIYGAGIALATDEKAASQVVPHVFRQGSQIVRGDLAKANYSYDVQDWYTLPRDLRRPVWSEPYFGEGSGALMVTYSVPIFAQGDKEIFKGVISCEVSLDWLTELLKNLPLGQKGTAFLITPNGTFIANTTDSMILREGIFSIAEQQQNQRLRELGQKMVRGETGFIIDADFDQNKGGLVYTPVKSTGWSLGIFLPREEFMAKIVQLSKYEAKIGFLGFIMLLIVALYIARSISDPLRKLEKAARILASGDLDAKLPSVTGENEVARLANSFSVMRDAIKTHLNNLSSEIALRERVESELAIARNIQMSLVPRTFPAFPTRDDFELFAMMNPAKEVGGDFYDYFMPDEEHICIVIGDVSGKGIPAALFMAVTRSFLRAFLQEDTSPGATLAQLNHELTQDNDACMFVTLFCAVIHLPTGLCRFANGGHNPPVFVRANGELEQLTAVKGTALGILDGIEFMEGELRFNPGDLLLGYTDGVTEAMNSQGQWFGVENMLRIISALKDKSCTDILNSLKEEVETFAAGAEQSDDITMVAFRLTPAGGGLKQPDPENRKCGETLSFEL